MDREVYGLPLDGVQSFNRSVLGAIYDLGVCSRKDISVRTGLDQATVTRALAPLIEAELVEEFGFSKGVRGRRTISLRLSARRYRVIAVRLKRRSFVVALFDLRGGILSAEDVPIDAGQDPGQTFEQITCKVSACLDRSEGQVLGIGIALPGPFMQSDERIILMTESPEWQTFDLVHALRGRFADIPVFSGHDAKVAALTVWRDTAVAIGARVMLYVLIGQGVGSAIVIDGQVFQGSTGLAGELGHTSIDMHGPRCKCGNRGCLELYASTLALLRQARDGIRDGATTILTEAASIGDLSATYRDGDPLAVAIGRRLATHLAQSLANSINFLNPDLIVLGEEAVGFGEGLLDDIRSELRDIVLPAILEKIKIISFGIDGDIAVVGSYLNVLQQSFIPKRSYA